MPVMYFVHPQTKGRARVRVTRTKDAKRVAALFTSRGYRRVSAEEYRAWVRRYPLAELDAQAVRRDEDEETSAP